MDCTETRGRLLTTTKVLCLHEKPQFLSCPPEEIAWRFELGLGTERLRTKAFRREAISATATLIDLLPTTPSLIDTRLTYTDLQSPWTKNHRHHTIVWKERFGCFRGYVCMYWNMNEWVLCCQRLFAVGRGERTFCSAQSYLLAQMNSSLVSKLISWLWVILGEAGYQYLHTFWRAR